MKYGYWLPVFGGWLRNVDDEQMETSWEYSRRLAQRSEEIGFDLTLIAELSLNDIKGADAPTLDAWSTAAALAAATKRLELMVAVRPTFHNPALLAKQAANIDGIAGPGRLSLNVVSSWWADEAKKCGLHFETHDDRYARTAEWLAVVDGIWKQDHFSFTGKYYKVEDSVMQPKPITKPRPIIYAGGESEAAKELIAERCDAYVMHGDPPQRIREKITDMSARRERKGLPPMTYGVAAYSIVRDTEGRSEARAGTDHGRETKRARLRQLSAMARGHEPGSPSLAGRLLRHESRSRVRSRRDSGTGAGTSGSIRGCGRRSPALAMQPAIRRDGALRGERHPLSRAGRKWRGAKRGRRGVDGRRQKQRLSTRRGRSPGRPVPSCTCTFTLTCTLHLPETCRSQSHFINPGKRAFGAYASKVRNDIFSD